ncbi:MAG: ammonia channel protein [Verrucomicrobiales bacterium]|nr:ammonia channel protein [Verrucomicrobiales bacterium]
MNSDNNGRFKRFLAAIIGFGAISVFAQDGGISAGDTAWILVATALVLFMNIPGLALFYGGLVRKKNVLSVLMQCFVLTAVMTVLWTVVGYSLAFSGTGMSEGEVNLRSFVGGLDLMMLKGVTPDTPADNIPKLLHFVFQMTFFIITPALMVGAFVDRIKFSAVLWFTILWNLLVYAPVCHMVWGGAGGYFADMGVQDFAGGIVVHITAGVGALVACIVLGPRNGYPKKPMPPHNLPMTVMGAAMLWVGWFGFNGGSQLAADGGAASAIVVTQISAATATLAWMFIEWAKFGKPSMLGAATGSIAGLAAITPASGTVGPIGALVIGAMSGTICWWASTVLKQKLKYDDSLDVFGVHGVGGFIGTVMLAFLMSEELGGVGYGEGVTVRSQFGVQLFAAVATAVYTAIVSFIILKIVCAVVGLRVSEAEENEGLDLAYHGEEAYND